MKFCIADDKVYKNVYIDYGSDMKVKILLIYGEEVLLCIISKYLFLYNMRLSTLGRVHEKPHNQHLKVVAVCHVNNLSTTHTNKIVYLSTKLGKVT